MQQLATIFKALSDETRLQILALLLWQGELCVCDVEAVLDITQSKASRHLRYLQNANLVQSRRVGVWMHYDVARPMATQPGLVLRLLKRMLTIEALQQLHKSLDRRLKERGIACRCCAD